MILENDIIIAALLGALGSLFVSLLIKKLVDLRYSKQVKYMILEGCRKIVLYLETMLNEDEIEAKQNIEARIYGFKTIEKLLSEMDIKLISTKDIFVMFRVREIIDEIVFDFEIFHKNLMKIRQYNSDLKVLMNEKTEKNIEYSEIIQQNDKEVEEQLKRLTEQIKIHIDLLSSVKPNYKKIAKEIYKLNKISSPEK